MAVMHEIYRLMFMPELDETAEIFPVKALITSLQSCDKKRLIWGTTGSAAIQYPGGTTHHSVCHLGIDKQFTRFSDPIPAAALLKPGASWPPI
jgi:hypothetical protein